MAINPLDSTHPSVFPASLSADAADSTPPEGVSGSVAGNTPRIGWRRHALLLAAIVGCLTIFLLARVMANQDRKSTRLNSSHSQQSRMPSSA